MNVIFLTLVQMQDISSPGIYTDLMRKFRDEGHNVYVVSPIERRLGLTTSFENESGIHVLRVETLNITKSGIVEKGIGTILLELQYKNAIRKYLKGIQFDLILYSTPPITFTNVVITLKKSNPKAFTYLLLKDIFPQNAVDIGLLSATGIKGVMYKYFRRIEKKLYDISDYIGCMSPANVDYIIKNNPQLKREKLEIAPNSYSLKEVQSKNLVDILEIRKKYNLPVDKPIFIYGGNMGKPQGVPFVIECLRAIKDRNDCHFVVVGDGTEYPKLKAFIAEENPQAVSLINKLNKDDYDKLAKACDIGLIFLDYRFTIPNYPSRLLPYLMERKPIVAVTDSSSDVGTIAQEYGYGFYSPSNSVNAFVQTIDRILMFDFKQMGEKGYQFFLNNYTIDHTYNVIVNHFK